MPQPPARRPSTLSADKARAASRPLGWIDPRPQRAPEPAPVNTLLRPSNSAAERATVWVSVPSRVPPTVRSAPERPAASPPPRPTTVVNAGMRRERRDSLIVSSFVVAFVLLTIGIAGASISGNVSVNRSRDALAGTLSAVYDQQSSFRLLNQRFATWPELEAQGMRLPPRQRLVRSNADRSHWFLSLRDMETGVTCSRTGELFDDSATDRLPTCTMP